MQQINNPLKRSFRKNHLHRTLLRTESSLQKIIQISRQDSIKKIKYFLQNQLRYCSLQKSSQRYNSSNPPKLITQISQLSLHNRQKGRKLFMKAKMVNKNQTFLGKIKKQTKSKLQQMAEQKGVQKHKQSLIRTINSVKDMNTDAKTSLIDSKQISQNFNKDNKQGALPIQTRYRTISYDQQSKYQDQMTSQKTKDKSKMQTSYKKLNSDNSSFKVRLQKFRQDNIKIELSQSTVEQQKVNKLPQFQPRLITFQPHSSTSNLNQVQKDKKPIFKIANQEYRPTVQATYKANAFFDQQIDSLYANIAQIQTKQRSTTIHKKQINVELNQSRQSIYKQADNNSEFYIEEIVLMNTSNNFNNQNTDNQKKNITAQNIQKQKISNSFDLKNSEVLLPFLSKSDQQNSRRNQYYQGSQESTKQEKFKSIIIQKTNKINSYRQQLYFFGELAGFFSKNSKAYKINKESSSFIKDGSVTWHLLIYLFFKYFYSMNVLFLKYYKIQGKFTINQQKLAEYTQEISKLAQTLKKIQKSTRKAIPITEVQGQLISDFDYLKELQIPQTINQIIDFYLNQSGDQTKHIFTSFLKDLRISIFNQASKFIKNMKIGNILKHKSAISIILYDGLFRIFNSCIILYQFYRSDSQRLETVIEIQKLNFAPIELFEKKYIKISQEILAKRQ